MSAATPGLTAVEGRWVRVPASTLVTSAPEGTTQAVAVALKAEDLGLVHQAVDHRRRRNLVAEDLAQPEKRLLEVTIRQARS